MQLFPYHLSEYVCRVLRVTPFKYYCDLLYTVMREEKSYDQIPNFAVSRLMLRLTAIVSPKRHKPSQMPWSIRVCFMCLMATQEAKLVIHTLYSP